MRPPLSSAELPVVRRNRWRDASRDLPSDWTPWRTVSVVIPSYNSSATLDLTLASLAAQDYPAELLDILVVDDGSATPYELPKIRPARSRIIRPAAGWGRANACHTGALETDGEIILWLDSDMIVPSDHVRAHLEWYDRVADVVTKGDILFVADSDLTPAGVFEKVQEGSIGAYLTANGYTRQWVEKRYAETDDLNTDRHDVFSIWTGATASISRALYELVGGMDTALRLGEDSELAYRLWNAGAVFVPARNATAWHLGMTNTQRRNNLVAAHDKAYFAQRAPMLTGKRTGAGRIWEVPLVHAVVRADVSDIREASVAVERLLASSEHDIRVDLVAPWDTMHEGRRRVLDDEDAQLYIAHEWFRGDPRVRLVTEAPDRVYPAAYRLDVPARAGIQPGTLKMMIKRLSDERLGLLRVAFDAAGGSIDLWRVAALERASRHRREGENLQQAVDRVWGVWWAPPEEFPFDDLADQATDAISATASAGQAVTAAPSARGGADALSRIAALEVQLSATKQKLRRARRAAVRPEGVRSSLRAIRSDLVALAHALHGKMRPRRGQKGA